MPLVRRKVQQDVESFFGKQTHDHVLYVPPSKVRPGDVTVEPTDKQLADLAARFPKEFAKKAAERGIEPYTVPDDDGPTAEDVDDVDLDDLDDEEEEEEAASTDDVEEEDEADVTSREFFVALSATEAAAAVAEQQEAEVLAAWHETETSRKSPRASVLKAFKAKGLR